jgi:hypothetical protein
MTYAEWTSERATLRDMAIEQILLAYAKGELNSGKIEWEDIEIAFEYADGAKPGRYQEILRELGEDDEAE